MGHRQRADGARGRPLPAFRLEEPSRTLPRTLLAPSLGPLPRWVADHLGFDYNFVVSGALNLLAIGLMGAALPSRTRGERRILQQRQLQQRQLQQSHLAARRADGLAAAADSAREPLQRPEDCSPSSRQLPAVPADATLAAATTEAETAEAEAEAEAGVAEAEAEEAASLASAALRPRFVFFLCEMMAIGLAFTVVEKFIFVFIIKELGGSQSLCGYSVAVNVIFEVPIFHFGDALLRTLGHEALPLLPLPACCEERLITPAAPVRPWSSSHSSPTRCVSSAIPASSRTQSGPCSRWSRSTASRTRSRGPPPWTRSGPGGARLAAVNSASSRLWR